jgi:hypothetical protein
VGGPLHELTAKIGFYLEKPGLKFLRSIEQFQAISIFRNTLFIGRCFK